MTEQAPQASPLPRTNWSLRLRILIAGGLIVLVFMLLTGFALERAFTSSAIDASMERLQARIYMLMGAVEVSPLGNIELPEQLADPDLAIPNSGELAAITDINGSILWRSESSLAMSLIYPTPDEAGKPTAGNVITDSGATVYTVSLPLIWELESGVEYGLTFHAAEDAAKVAANIAAFRGTLQLWLGTAGLCLLLLQIVLLNWALRPLRQVAAEVTAIESGERTQLGADYPHELRPLTDNLNAVLTGAQERVDRHRNALSDLSHSLKTPLAVMRASTTDANNPAQQASINRQLDRLDETISYQLQRAAASGRSPLTAPVAVADVVRRIVSSLDKVYHDKHIRFDVRVAEQVQFAGDAGDLAELLGNLGDNACKWCLQRVAIAASNRTDPVSGTQLLVITVADDGKGIPAGLHEGITERGTRADPGVPGHGVGLAIVRDIVVDVYAGQLEFAQAELGGAEVKVII